MKFLWSALSCAIFLNVAPAMAFFGNDKGNGGDACEERFTAIRDDLKNWILRGGSSGLSLEMPVAAYNSSMLKVIDAARVSCTDQPVLVLALEKTCKNLVDEAGFARIICNRKAFEQTAEEDQYALVHHEYAGLAGFEANVTEESNYPISRQIAAFLEVKVLKKLALKLPELQAPNKIREAFGKFVGLYKIVHYESRINKERDRGPRETYKYAEIFFGDGYRPLPDGNKLVLVLSDSPEGFGAGLNIAYDENAPGMICSTFPGEQFCSSLGQGFVLRTSIKEEGGLVLLEEMASWPNQRENFLYRSHSIKMERVSQ